MARVDLILTVTTRVSGLERTIDTVRAQSVRDWRMLAVIGPGVEGARALLDGADERITIIEARRGGAAAMRNLALAELASSHAMFLEAGDALAPSALSHLLAAAAAGTHGAACGSWLVAGEAGIADGPPIDPPEGSVGLGDMESLLRLPPAAVLLGADLIEGMRFGANLETWSHTDFWLRICEDSVRLQVVPSVVASIPHDAGAGDAGGQRAEELRRVIERAFQRASAKGWEDERLDEAHEAATIRRALFEQATRSALAGTGADATRAAESFAGVAEERCLSPDLLAEATALALRTSPSHRARIDGTAERSWARPVHEWWSRCVTQKWIARQDLEEATRALAFRLVDPRDVAKRLLGQFGQPGRVWVGGTDRSARAVIGEALETGWRVLVLPGKAARGVNQRLMALPSRVMVASANEGIGSNDPLVIGSADEAELLERYGARPNTARWNGAWRTAYEEAARRLESAWPRRDG